MSKLAILLATYNGENYITELLESLLNQTCQDFTVYIHDDGSTDSTKDILKKYSENYPSKFVRLGGSSAGGAKENFFFLMSQMIDADYFMFCDQDDVWLPEKISRTLTAIKALTELHSQDIPLLVYSDMFVTDEALHITADSFINTIGRDGHRYKYSQALIDNPAAGCTMCFNRTLKHMAVDALEGADLSKIPMHDAWVLEIASIYGKISFIEEAFVYYRQTGNNVMGAKAESKIKKIQRNLSDLFSGRIKKRKKEFVFSSREFAKELIRINEKYPMEEEILSTLEKFTNIGDFPKPDRVRFYLKNDFTRAHGTFYMMLWV